MARSGRGDRDNRREARSEVQGSSGLWAFGLVREVRLLNASTSGALLDSGLPLIVDDRLALVRDGLRLPCRVVWKTGRHVGLEIAEPVSGKGKGQDDPAPAPQVGRS